MQLVLENAEAFANRRTISITNCTAFYFEDLLFVKSPVKWLRFGSLKLAIQLCTDTTASQRAMRMSPLRFADRGSPVARRSLIDSFRPSLTVSVARVSSWNNCPVVLGRITTGCISLVARGLKFRACAQSADVGLPVCVGSALARGIVGVGGHLD